jgi:translation initiation factor IF-1
MAEETIDFGNFSRKIYVNPIVPLQLLQLKCRNGNRIQATILGKVYSSHIDILEILPVTVCEENKVIHVKVRLKR